MAQQISWEEFLVRRGAVIGKMILLEVGDSVRCRGKIQNVSLTNGVVRISLHKPRSRNLIKGDSPRIDTEERSSQVKAFYLDPTSTVFYLDDGRVEIKREGEGVRYLIVEQPVEEAWAETVVEAIPEEFVELLASYLAESSENSIEELRPTELPVVGYQDYQLVYTDPSRRDAFNRELLIRVLGVKKPKRRRNGCLPVPLMIKHVFKRGYVTWEEQKQLAQHLVQCVDCDAELSKLSEAYAQSQLSLTAARAI